MLIFGLAAAHDSYAQECPAKPGCANGHAGLRALDAEAAQHKWTLDRVITRVMQEERLLFSNATV